MVFIIILKKMSLIANNVRKESNNKLNVIFTQSDVVINH